MIRTQNLTKSFRRKTVLRGVTFTARAGEITLLVGPNGAGKSTTMKLLTGLALADGGHALIGDQDIVREKIAAQRLLSFLPQTPNFHPRFTCAQIVAFYARLRGVDCQRRTWALEQAGLSDVAHEQTRTLSGGMRQRLGLALLLLPDAPVLLLDEPGLSLDPAWRRRLQSIVHDEAHRGKTVLITTHLIAEWNNIAHRCLLCRAGVIERELDPANLSGDFDDFNPPPSGSPTKDVSNERRIVLA
ncbi:MAG: ABC transporter ATP-binding protein [Chthoniobacteraceae bacterium]